MGPRCVRVATAGFLDMFDSISHAEKYYVAIFDVVLAKNQFEGGGGGGGSL